jgi:shikimate kinase
MFSVEPSHYNGLTPMKIYLVGFMGSGKTTIGRELAARLDAPFFDLDELITSAEKATVREIFARQGEPYFRKRERDLLRSTRYLDTGVIATGGGTFTFEENIQFVKSEGFSVYLSAPYQLLRTRAEVKSDRPLFDDDVAAHELYANRIRYYRMADLTIDVREDERPAEIVERVLLELPRNFFEAAREAVRRR